jgi:hypothetical protein
MQQAQEQTIGGWTKAEVLALPQRWQDAFQALSATLGMAFQCDDEGIEAAMHQCLATLHQEAQQRGLL